MKSEKFYLLAVAACLLARPVAAETYDVVVYGSSPAGIAAAVQATRMGSRAVVVSPETRIGGLTTGGLGNTDIGNKTAFGGLALDFYRDVAKYYDDPANWTWQKRKDFSHVEQGVAVTADSMWVFEPSAALKILENWEKREGLEIVRGERLNRASGKVKVRGAIEDEGRNSRSEANGLREQRRIVSFETESGKTFAGKVFIDATYEGDLMAAAGVSYTVGREANAQYGETLSGCQRARAKYHQFEKGVSGYVRENDPSSGLLPGVERDDGRPDGTGDRCVQAYCFRMCLTDVPENRIPFAKPANYDERAYELLFRNLARQEALHPDYKDENDGWTGLCWINAKMPNGKTDTNNRLGVSLDLIGRNHGWAEASYAERERIFGEHLDYQRGLMWTLANHPRVPEWIRNVFSRWGTCKDEFADGVGDGWQGQLYVREARRMVGDYVMTEANCRGTRVAPRPVAMAAYTMDSHHVRRLADAAGHVFNEGDVEVDTDERGVKFPPYPIDYGAIVPKRGECANLLVPVCVSASHIAFGSIRMEPVFFALGQVAGTAAAQAAAAGCAVQDLPYGPLAARLACDGQVLAAEPPAEVVVAAANSRAFERRAADFVCTGRNDELVLNGAIARLTRGGTVRLADGDYYIDAFEQEGGSAVCFGYNGGSARTITFTGTTENKSYNTRHGVTIHVTKPAMDRLDPKGVYRVFYGAGRKPKAEGDFFTYTHVNNVNFSKFYLFLADASKPIRGIDGSHFGQMYLDLVGVYAENYFRDRFLHLKPATPCRGSVGVWSVPGSCDEMSRVGYDWVNVGGLHTGFYFDGVDHLVMRSCSAARCCYGYRFKGGPKTLTMLNCCDEGNAHLPRFDGAGHLTALDFNIERFNAAFIPDDPDGNAPVRATETRPGAWHGEITYTLQGDAFDVQEKPTGARTNFWEPGCGENFRTVNLDGPAGE